MRRFVSRHAVAPQVTDQRQILKAIKHYAVVEFYDCFIHETEDPVMPLQQVRVFSGHADCSVSHLHWKDMHHDGVLPGW